MADVRINHDSDTIDVVLGDDQKILGIGPDPDKDVPFPEHYLMEAVESRDGTKKTWHCGCGYSLEVPADRVLTTYEQHSTPAPRTVAPTSPVPDDKPRFKRGRYLSVHKYEFIKGSGTETVYTERTPSSGWLDIGIDSWVFTESVEVSGAFLAAHPKHGMSINMTYCFSRSILRNVEVLTEEEEQHLLRERRRKERSMADYESFRSFERRNGYPPRL